MSRADFYAELVALKDQIHAGHLAILEKLDANHRELLAALERQATRINALKPASPAWTSAPAREGERPREPKISASPGSREVRARGDARPPSDYQRRMFIIPWYGQSSGLVTSPLRIGFSRM